jgi:hypothetical protein
MQAMSQNHEGGIEGTGAPSTPSEQQISIALAASFFSAAGLFAGQSAADQEGLGAGLGNAGALMWPMQGGLTLPARPRHPEAWIREGTAKADTPKLMTRRTPAKAGREYTTSL